MLKFINNLLSRPRPAALAPLLLLAALLMLAAAPVLAGCERPISVPLAPVGMSVIVDGDRLRGIYPAMLEQIAARTGCRFTLSVVPQARLEAMYELGSADIMMPGVETERRKRFGQFVPLSGTRAMLLSVDHRRPPVHNLQELMRRHELRVAVVRGNDYGSVYQTALAELERQKRLYFESDPLRVARLLGQGLADVTILTPMSLAHVMKGDERVRPLLERLRIEELPELPWRENGAYLSLKSLTAQQRTFLAAQLRDAYDAAEVAAEYRRYYPANVVSANQRPRPIAGKGQLVR